MIEGAIRVELRVHDGRVREVAVRSSRRADVSRALAGMPVPQALALVPSLFAVCGAAHGAAAAAAFEAAEGILGSPDRRRARRRIAALEAIDNHVLARCVAEPKLLGLPALAASLRRARAATAALRAGRTTAALMRELRAAIAEITPEESALEDDRALAAWAASTPSGALISVVIRNDASGFGRTDTSLLPALPASWFAARLGRPEMCAEPTLDGVPAESGPLARMARDPAVVRRGRTLLGRLVARLIDLRAWVDAIEPIDIDDPEIDGVGGRGTGTGVAETSRGRLAHQVEVAGGRVLAWRTVAPTEWTFHPEGVVRRALLGAPAGDLARRATWLLAALDPCVPFAVSVGE